MIEPQELEEITEVETVGVDLAEVAEQRSNEALPALEGLIEQREVPQRDQAEEHGIEHPQQRRAGDRQRHQFRAQSGRVLLLHQIQPLASKSLPQVLVSVLEVTAETEQSQFTRIEGVGQERVKVPGSAAWSSSSRSTTRGTAGSHEGRHRRREAC